MLKRLFFVPLISLFLFTNVYAGETSKVHLDAKVEHVQKYMWRGLDVLPDDDGAVQPDFTLDLGETGFYVGLWGSFGYDSKWRIWDELDFYGGYYSTFMEETRHAVDFDFGYTYFLFPSQGRSVDTQEVAFAFSLPKLLPNIGPSNIVPYTTFYYGWSTEGTADEGLWVKLGASYDLPIPNLMPQQKEQALSIYVETFHNDGAQSFQTKTGWSHLATGISTSIEWHKLVFTPGINYQWSWEDTVNSENEFWFTFSISHSPF